MVSALDQLYQQVIMDHAAEKHGSSPVTPSDTSSYQVNPTCGDEVTLAVTLEGDTLVGLAWQGQGCSISQASLSMMNDLVAGKSLAEVEQLWKDFDQMMHSRGLELPDEVLDSLEDAASLQGTSKFPNRVKCALLGWMALRESIGKTQARQEHE